VPKGFKRINSIFSLMKKVIQEVDLKILSKLSTIMLGYKGGEVIQEVRPKNIVQVISDDVRL